MLRKREYDPSCDVRQTPPSFFEPLHRERNYTIDACALACNTMLPLFYSTEGLTALDDTGAAQIILPGVDGLTGPYDGQRVWCNPPFSQFDLWLPWAWKNSDAELITMLAPATRTDRPWWQKWVEPYRDDQPERRDASVGPTGPEFITIGEKAWRLHTKFMTGRIDFLEDGHPIWQKDKLGQVILKKSGKNKGKPQESTAMFGCVLLEWRHV